MVIKTIKNILFPKSYCLGCGKKESGDEMMDAFHQSDCIDAVLGYDVYNEKITPETRTYFFKQRQYLRQL